MTAKQSGTPNGEAEERNSGGARGRSGSPASAGKSGCGKDFQVIAIGGSPRKQDDCGDGCGCCGGDESSSRPKKAHAPDRARAVGQPGKKPSPLILYAAIALVVLAALLLFRDNAGTASAGTTSQVPPGAVGAAPTGPEASQPGAAGLTQASTSNPSALLQQKCGTRCHGLSKVQSARLDSNAWLGVIDRMQNNGASLTRAESQSLAQYLSTN